MAQTRIREASEASARRAGGGLGIGSVLGFQISLDYSWFILLFLILGTLSGVVFPDELPGLDRPIYLAMGTAGTVLFFASLLGHELAHSVVARMKGIEVEGITLFIFGGMARTRSEATTPGDEFQIAGVGPLASLAFAGLFYGIAAVSPGVGLGPPVQSVASYLGLVNLALALFNLLPGFPLDGGRLLRAVVWKSTSDFRRATRIATLGYGIAGMGIAGIVFAGSLVSGLWFVFIGWFLANAANASYQQVMLRHVLGGLTAEDAMTPDPATVPPDLGLDELVTDHFLREPFNAFPVDEDGVPVGIVTLSQVKAVPRAEWRKRRVADVMTPLEETVIVEPDSPMPEVLRVMNENASRRVLVAREWELVGIITAHDVTRRLDRASLLPG